MAHVLLLATLEGDGIKAGLRSSDVAPQQNPAGLKVDQPCLRTIWPCLLGIGLAKANVFHAMLTTASEALTRQTLKILVSAI